MITDKELEFEARAIAERNGFSFDSLRPKVQDFCFDLARAALSALSGLSPSEEAGEREALREEVRERTALRYMGDCKCGKCQLVPRELLARVYVALASPSPPKEAAQDMVSVPRALLNWIDEWVSRPIGAYSITAIGELFGQTRERLDAVLLAASPSAVDVPREGDRT